MTDANIEIAIEHVRDFMEAASKTEDCDVGELFSRINWLLTVWDHHHLKRDD